MAMHGDVSNDDSLYIFHEKFGFLRAWAEQDKQDLLGTSAYLDVGLQTGDKILPGVAKMTINTNYWDVYAENDPEGLTKMAEYFVPRPVH